MPFVPVLAFLCLAPNPPQTPSVNLREALRVRVELIHDVPATLVRGQRLHQADAVAHFFEARNFQPVWTSPTALAEIVRAIREIDRDGLTPADYHLAAIESLPAAAPTVAAEVDRQVLLADAVAALLDHVRYGKVRPVSLDRRWNIDPRAGATPLYEALATVASAPSPLSAVESFKPAHFIYQGLKRSLAALRALEAAGGWPGVADGGALKPGVSDVRVAAVRRRLAATGELPAGASVDSLEYDGALETAVKRFQERHRLAADGAIGRATIRAMNITARSRIDQVRVNLERARWVVGGLSDSFLLVNLPAFKAYLIRDRANVWEARTQIGREARQTPAFRADMRYVVFNPDWTVPPTILAQDVLTGMRKGENTINRKHLTIYDRQGRVVDPSAIEWAHARPGNFPYTLRQAPGPDNALGRVKFVFPNEHSIFLHDTPSRELFASDQRTFSSGCIRVERPLELAERLLSAQGVDAARMQEILDSGKSETIFLDQPLPVLIVYWTVSVGASGELRFARDVYNLDARVLRALG